MGTNDRIFENWGRVRTGSSLSGPHSRSVSVSLSLRPCSVGCPSPYLFMLWALGTAPFLLSYPLTLSLLPDYTCRLHYIWLLFLINIIINHNYITIPNRPFVKYTWWLYHLFPSHPWLVKEINKGPSDEVIDNVSLEEGSHEKIQERTC